MKKNIFFSLFALVGITTSILLLDACKLKNPTDGFKIIVKADALQAPNNFFVLDSKTGNQADLPANYEVAVTGPGAAYVFSPGGTKKIVVIQGVLQFSLRKGFVPTAANPIKFNFEFHNSKYLDLVYPVEITSLDQFSENISLVNFDNPPSGSTGKKQDVPADTSGKTTTKVEIVIPKAQGKEEAATVEIEAGTQLKDKDGNNVVGTIEAKILHATPTDSSIGSFPGGITIAGTKDASGAALPGGEISTTGWVNFEMSAGGKQVKTFSQPVSVNMEIKPGTINPKTGVAYVAGDDLDVYSLSAGENTWVKEGTTKVVKNDSTNKLEAPMSINHLSVWMAGIILAPCGNVLELGYDNSANVNAISGKFEVYSIANALLASVNFTVPASNSNYRITVGTFRPSEGTKYNVKITFEGVSNPVEFNNTVLCNSALKATVPTINTNQIQFKVKMLCTNGNQVLLPDNYTIYYIKETEYQNTIVRDPNNSSKDHKIDPSDGLVDGVEWKKKQLRAITGSNEAYNLISFSVGDDYFTSSATGTQYRFAVYYNDGSKSSREDYVTPAPGYTDAIKGSGVYSANITLKTCPL
jgi:hypothetical protein